MEPGKFKTVLAWVLNSELISKKASCKNKRIRPIGRVLFLLILLILRNFLFV